MFSCEKQYKGGGVLFYVKASLNPPTFLQTIFKETHLETTNTQ